MNKLIFDEINCRVVTEDGKSNVFSTDTLKGDFHCAVSSIHKVVKMYNEGKSLREIDEFLLDDFSSTQEAREIISESLYHFLHIKSFICSPYMDKPIPFYGDPISYNLDGLYGYLTPIGDKVFFFSAFGDGKPTYSKLDNWYVAQPK